MKIVEDKDDFGRRVNKIYNDNNQLIEEQTFKKIFGLFIKKMPIEIMKYEYVKYHFQVFNVI